jgi:hypothetical protein
MRPSATPPFAALAALALLALAACAPRADTTPYPADRTLARGPELRRDFVDSFLQGRWCEAEALYAEAIDTAVRRDDFCAAAHTARLAARLHAYAGQDAPELERTARALRGAALDCPGDEDTPARDRRYEALVRAGDFGALARALDAEPDALYVSVYARKGARAALAAGQKADARALAEAARATDARQGWVTLLAADWGLRLELEDDPATRQTIRERIRLLEQRIAPCP